MRNRRKTLVRLGLVAAIIVGSVTVVIRLSSPREPIYQNHPLSYWLNQLPLTWGTSNTYATMEAGFINLPNGGSVHFGATTPKEREAALTAVDELGTNALPTLVAFLGTGGFRLPSILKEWGLKLRILDPNRELTAFVRRGQAVTALRRLGNRARPVIPELKALTRSKDVNVNMAARAALQKVAPEEYTKLEERLKE